MMVSLVHCVDCERATILDLRSECTNLMTWRSTMGIAHIRNLSGICDTRIAQNCGAIETRKIPDATKSEFLSCLYSPSKWFGTSLLSSIVN